MTGVFNIDDDIPMEAPFLQLKTWKTIQFNDSTHTRLKEMIRSGQTPIKKKTGGQETVLKLLHTHFTKKNLKIDPSGVIMIKQKQGHYDGYSISVPTSIFPGLVYAYHNKCSHPTKSQMLKLMSRYFYCPGMQSIIDRVTDSCLQCVATSRIPKEVIPDSTTIPQGIGTRFSADVLERLGQNILLAKDDLSHYASAVLVEDQTANNLRQGIIQTLAPLVSNNGATLRLDCTLAFKSIAANQVHDVVLKKLNIMIELGDP